jgi:hypothetical protein
MARRTVWRGSRASGANASGTFEPDQAGDRTDQRRHPGRGGQQGRVEGVVAHDAVRGVGEHDRVQDQNQQDLGQD